MRTIRLLLSLVLLLAFVPVHAGSKPVPKIILRVNIQTAGQGLPESQAITVAIPPSGETIQVRTLPEATERNLVDVKTDIPGYVRLIFDHVGKVNLSASTGENQGRILIVALNGTIIYAPIIDQQITNGELDIPRKLTPEIIKLLQDIAAENVKQKQRT